MKKHKKGEKKEERTHESYGLLQISETHTSKPATLFGSKIKHGSYISIRVNYAKEIIDEDMYRDERYMDDGRVLEFKMSHKQFEQLSSQMSKWEGVPITFTSFGADRCEEPPPIETAVDEVSKKYQGYMDEITGTMNKLEIDAKSILNKKGPMKKADKADLKFIMLKAFQTISFNFKFIDEVVQEKLEATLEDFKSDVGYLVAKANEATHALTQANKGILPRTPDILQIEKHDEK